MLPICFLILVHVPHSLYYEYCKINCIFDIKEYPSTRAFFKFDFVILCSMIIIEIIFHKTVPSLKEGLKYCN